MSSTKMRQAIEKQVGDAAYLFGYATVANELVQGEDPFYFKTQSTQAAILAALEPIVEALSPVSAGHVKQWQQAKYRIGETTARRVIQIGTSKRIEQEKEAI